MSYTESKKAVGISHFPSEEEAERQKCVIEPSHIKAQTSQRTQTKGSPVEARQQGHYVTSLLQLCMNKLVVQRRNCYRPHNDSRFAMLTHCWQMLTHNILATINLGPIVPYLRRLANN